MTLKQKGEQKPAKTTNFKFGCGKIRIINNTTHVHETAFVR